MPKRTKILTKEILTDFFKKLDLQLTKNVEIVVIGGASIVLLEIKDRATNDIDLLPTNDNLEMIIKIAKTLHVSMQIVTVTSTIDFNTEERICVFTGKHLKVFSLNPLALIKSKLERYTRQDPEDILALIKKINLNYKKFLNLFAQMLPMFIGDPNRLIMHARSVVELVWQQDAENFYQKYKLSFE